MISPVPLELYFGKDQEPMIDTVLMDMIRKGQVIEYEKPPRGDELLQRYIISFSSIFYVYLFGHNQANFMNKHYKF